MTDEQIQRLEQVRACEKLEIIHAWRRGERVHPIVNDVRFLLNIIDAQEEELSKLPLTADGVRVVPGMQVYSVIHNRVGGADIGLAQAMMQLSDEDLRGAFENCYSTRSAAEASIKARETK